MADATAISWCKRTWSPWLGCTKVSPACDHCYAEAWAKRSGLVGWGPHVERRRTSAAYWTRPLLWNEAAKRAGVRESVFPSLCDPFDNAADPAWRRDHFELIRQTPWLDHLLLTKRVGNVQTLWPPAAARTKTGLFWWPRNAWLGATIVTQAEADRDIPKLIAAKLLLGIPVIFLSLEPLQERILLRPEWLAHIDWVIVGGESGPGARPMHPDWARQIRDDCAAAGVAFHFKQHGEWVGAEQVANNTVTKTTPWLAWSNGQWTADHLAYDRVYRLGNKAAGRLLDGALHDARPAA